MFSKPYLSDEQLRKTDKILFITHLAIGDYVYMQQFFQKLSEQYPNLKIDLWIDDIRRTYHFWKWKHYKKYILYDWVKESKIFNKVYTSTYSPFVFRKSIKEARSEKYPVVVALCIIRARKYARIARTISPYKSCKDQSCKDQSCNVIGIKSRHGHKFNDLDHELPYTYLDKPSGSWKITDLYARWFKYIFNLDLSERELIPKLEIPSEWDEYGVNYFRKHNLEQYDQIILLNAFAKDHNRRWSSEKLKELIDKLNMDEQFDNYCFILNAPPENYKEVKDIVSKAGRKVFMLEASGHFFQLISVIKKCDLIVTAETCFIHLATALNIPIISLMRINNPEWIPNNKNNFIIFANNDGSCVEKIPAEIVFNKIKEFYYGN